MRPQGRQGPDHHHLGIQRGREAGSRRGARPHRRSLWDADPRPEHRRRPFELGQDERILRPLPPLPWQGLHGLAERGPRGGHRRRDLRPQRGVRQAHLDRQHGRRRYRRLHRMARPRSQYDLHRPLHRGTEERPEVHRGGPQSLQADRRPQGRGLGRTAPQRPPPIQGPWPGPRSFTNPPSNRLASARRGTSTTCSTGAWPCPSSRL